MEPNTGYEIGYAIGSYLPFFLIAGAMILVYRLARKKQKRIEDEEKN